MSTIITVKSGENINELVAVAKDIIGPQDLANGGELRPQTTSRLVSMVQGCLFGQGCHREDVAAGQECRCDRHYASPTGARAAGLKFRGEGLRRRGRIRLRHAHATRERAEQVAHAKLKALTRGRAQLSLFTPGSPMIAAETQIRLSGLRPGVDGLWLIANRYPHTRRGRSQNPDRGRNPKQLNPGRTPFQKSQAEVVRSPFFCCTATYHFAAQSIVE